MNDAPNTTLELTGGSWAGSLACNAIHGSRRQLSSFIRQLSYSSGDSGCQGTSDRRCFSAGWGIGSAAFHFVATLAIAGLRFITGMAAFTHDTSSAIAFWRALQWLWTPLAIAACDPHKSIDPGSLIGLAFAWSCIVGFLAPVIRHRLHRPLYLSARLDDRNGKAEQSH